MKKSDGRVKHGYSSHSLYDTWVSMRQRCNNENRENYPHYGGRGISVCDEWNNADTFIEWALNNGWKKVLQLDRRDNDGNYHPNNCRFVTPKINSNNR